jgi:hypothetical protein
MAGVKITDLGTLTTAVDADLLYIVDISDTSQSPQGTSKQIEVGNMFSSGTYTPTFSAYTNGIAVTPNNATFIKVGSIVSVSAQLEIVLDTAQTTGTFEMSLPVASDFANQKECFGILQYFDMVEIVNATISAETTNNTCAIDIEVATAAIDMQYVNMQFQYEVL